MKRGPRQLPRRERFEARVDRSGGPNTCHLWTLKPIKRGGYGHFYDDDGRLRRAHVIAWELHHGRPVPPGKVVMHRCDTPLCCNAERCLRLGSQGDNLADMHTKNRHRQYVTPELLEQALQVRGQHGALARLAREVGLKPDTLRRAVTRHQAGLAT